MNRSLFALMLSTFALGLSEFMLMGLLPGIAADLNVSEPKAGMLVTAYAAGVMAASPVITVLLSPLSRKRALIALLCIFTAGSILSAVSPDYNTLLASRIITSLAHGSFFGISSVLAMEIMPPDKRAGAVSLVFMGLTAANIGGVPLASYLGEIAGWRTAFAGTTILGAAAAIAVIINVPKGNKGAKADVFREFKALTSPSVLMVFAGTVLFAASLFTLYTYIAVVLRDLAGASPAFTAFALCLTGAGFTVGSLISGRLAVSWSADKAIPLFFLLTFIIMLIYPFAASSYAGAAVMTLLWGIAGYAPSPLLQTKIVREAKDAPALASSVNIGIFNLGNAIGAVIGGAVINAGLGSWWIAPAGGVAAALGAVSAIPYALRKGGAEKNFESEKETGSINPAGGKNMI